MLSHFKQLGKDSLTYGIMGAFAKLVSIILLPIFTRVFSTGEYGYLDIFITYVNFLAFSSALAIPGALLRYYKITENEKDDKSLYSTLLGFSTIVNLLFLSLVLIFSGELSEMLAGSDEFKMYIIIGGIAAIFQCLSRFPEIILRRERKIILYTSLNIAQSVLYALISLLLVLYFGYGLEGVFYALVLANLLKFLIGILYTRMLLINSFDKTLLKRSLKFSLPMYPAVFVTWANEQLNRIILLLLVGASGVGLFAAGARISQIVSLLTNVFRMAWDPFAMEMINKEGSEHFFKQVLKYYLGIFAIIGLSLTFFSQELMFAFLDKEYYDAIYVIPWLAGALIINDAGNLINIGSIIKEKTAINSIAAWIGLAINVGLTFLLVYYYGFFGAAIGAFVAQIVSKAILWSKSIKLANIDFDKIYAIKILVIYTVFSVVELLMYSMIEQYWLSLSVRTVLLFLVILLIYKITADELFLELLQQVKNKVKGIRKNKKSRE